MTQFQNNAVTAGLMVGVAFFIARIAMVRSLRDFFLALGTALMEVAVVLFLERRAKQLDAQIETWNTEQRKRRQAQELARTANESLGGLRALVNQIKVAIARIEEEHLKGRVWGNDLDVNKALAVAAIRSGYLEGIAENRTASIIPEAA